MVKCNIIQSVESVTIYIGPDMNESYSTTTFEFEKDIYRINKGTNNSGAVLVSFNLTKTGLSGLITEKSIINRILTAPKGRRVYKVFEEVIRVASQNDMLFELLMKFKDTAERQGYYNGKLAKQQEFRKMIGIG